MKIWSQQLEHKQVQKGTETDVRNGKRFMVDTGIPFSNMKSPSEDDIIKMLEFLVDNIFRGFCRKSLPADSSLLACHTRFKCSMETTRNSVKVKLGIKVMNLVKSLIGWKSL